MQTSNSPSTSPPWTTERLLAIMQPMWFGLVSERAAKLLLERGRIARYRSGDVIVEQGTPGKAILIVLSGQARVDSLGENGREFTRSFVGPGEGYSFMHVYHPMPHSSSLSARGECEMLVLARNEWHRTAEECSELKDAVIAIVTHRFRIALEMLDLNDSATGLGRLAHRLLWHVRRTPAEPLPEASGTSGIVVNLSQSELAKMLSVSRQRTNALLRQLEETGAITQKYGHILLNDIERLREVIATERSGVNHPPPGKTASRSQAVGQTRD